VIKIRRIILWTELCCLYLLGPIGLTALLRFELLDISKVPLVFFALFILSTVLLAKTPSFKWRSLLPSSWWPEWRTIVVFLLISATLMGLTIQLTNPNHFFGFPRRAPEIYLIVMGLYPILSVIPQGIIYRVLFFKRYGELFSDVRITLLMSAIAFCFAHLLFQNLFAVCLTFFWGARLQLGTPRSRFFLDSKPTSYSRGLVHLDHWLRPIFLSRSHLMDP